MSDIMRDKSEIEEMLNRVYDEKDKIDQGLSQGAWGQKYEEGLLEALEWVLGNSDDDLVG